MNTLNNTINSSKEDIIRSVQKCIQIKSMSENPDGTNQVLEFYLDLGQQMGFKAFNIENLGGLIEFGQGDHTIGIIVHLDVVPEGSGWNVPPFEGRVQDGKIYGRGAIDDKGPAIAALYALKAVKDSGFQPACKFQIIIGIDEETVWSKTPKLLEKIQEPEFSFVPDSKFPIVIAEKGLVWVELTKAFDQNEQQKGIQIQHLVGGGESLNIVPDFCEATLMPTNIEIIEPTRTKLEEWIKRTGYDIQLQQQSPGLKIVSKGKPAHAFNCPEGQNAISQLMLLLNELDLSGNQKHFIRQYAERLGMDHYGEALGLSLEDSLTGKLTISPGWIEMNEKCVTLKADIRFPASERLESMKFKIVEAFRLFGGELRVIDSLESLNFPEDDPNIQKLLNVYRDYTGDREAKPLGMGGTTFAKAFRNAAAFGPTFPGMPKVEHQPDEYIEVDHLLRLTEIYALAILALSEDDAQR